MNQATGASLEKAREEGLVAAATKRVQQCIGIASGHQQFLLDMRARIMGEHAEIDPPSDAPEPVRSDFEQLNHQIDILQETQERIGQHLDSLKRI